MGNKSGSDITVLFGDAVRKARMKMGISQEELSHRAGLHRTYISSVERGQRNVSLRNIEKIANALEVTIQSLAKGL